MGRFITPDPLGFIDGPNPYLYCLNDPVNFVDLWGLCIKDEPFSEDWITELVIIPVGAVVVVKFIPIIIGSEAISTLPITGFTKHGINQIITRGIGPKILLETLKNPIEIIKKIDTLGRVSYQYISKNAIIVINEAREVITGMKLIKQ